MSRVVPNNEELAAIVAQSKKNQAGYLESALRLYDLRCKRRKQFGITVLAFVGWGRSGKDTAAAFYSQHSHPKAMYGGSTSDMVCPIIADSMGQLPEQCFAERHSNREYWKAWCDEFRRNDPTIISRMLLGRGDILVGTRGWPELQATAEERVVDIVYWVDRPGTPPDFTVDFTFAQVMTLPSWKHLENDGTEQDLEEKIRLIARSLSPVRKRRVN